MRPVSPRFPDREETTIAGEQLEYADYAVAVIPQEPGVVQLVSRWTFTPEERARIASGADLYVSLLFFGRAISPIQLGLRETFDASPE